MSLSIPAFSEFSGNLGINRGGTNSTTALVGSSIIISNGSEIVQGELGTNTTVLHGNEFGAPFYAAVNLSDDVTSVLGIGNGGTNNWATPLAGQVLVGNFGTYTCANIAAGPNITVTNSNGGIEISSTAGSPAGATANIQYNDAGAFAASTTTLIDPADGRLMMGAVQTVPASNAAGVKLFAHTRARELPSWIGINGSACNLQNLIGNNKIAYATALGGVSTSMQILGCTTAESGTRSIRAIESTNKRTQIRRLVYQGTTSAANSVAGVRSVQQAWYRGDAAGKGGFHGIFRWGLGTQTGAGTSCCVGFSSSTAAYNPLVPTSDMTNILAFGGTLLNQIGFYHNDETGLATVVAFGVDFPMNLTDFYEGHIYCAPNSSDVHYYCKNIMNDAEASGTVSTNLPAATQLMVFRAEVSNGSSSHFTAIDVSSIYVETPY